MELSQAVRRIQSRLSGVQERWAFTGGVGLWLHGMAVTPTDIDIQTTERGAYQVEEALQIAMTDEVRWKESDTIRSHFGRGEFDNWTIEIMGAIEKRLPDGSWTELPELGSVVCDVRTADSEIPAMSLDHECHAYALLGRARKAELISAYLTGRTESGRMRKVTAFVRDTRGRIALFRHPSGQMQIPAGTVELDEEPQDAALREAREETGLQPLARIAKIGEARRTLPEDLLAVTNTTAVYSRPSASSFDWVTMRRGILVERLRATNGFTQIRYSERDSVDDPYPTYEIIGWIPSAALTNLESRYFYLFDYRGDGPETWRARTDNHTFELLWADDERLSEVTESQRWWLRYLSRTADRANDGTRLSDEIG